jgi:hypothetical protein
MYIPTVIINRVAGETTVRRGPGTKDLVVPGTKLNSIDGNKVIHIDDNTILFLPTTFNLVIMKDV